VHGIVAAHGGAITVESIQGEGTTFQILLPLAEGGIAEAVGPGANAAARGRELVLLVEDEAQVAAMMTHCLERLGYEVASCDDPNDALDTFAEDPDAWDVVVTDQTMPGLTGMDLSRRLLERRPDLPIVLCTGFSETANEETARAAGITAFLSKPVDPDKLAATVRAVLDRQAPDGLASASSRLPVPISA
jgi:CheY-like chemotaxis protein